MGGFRIAPPPGCMGWVGQWEVAASNSRIRSVMRKALTLSIENMHPPLCTGVCMVEFIILLHPVGWVVVSPALTSNPYPPL